MASSLKILEVCQVKPFSDTTESRTESCLPLTFFDTCFLNSPQMEYISYYKLAADPGTTFFNSAVLPSLKRSLSLTLAHYLPLTGHLRWAPEDATKPSIIYSPNGSVSLTVAERDVPDLLGGLALDGKPRAVAESRLYVPELQSSDSEAAVLGIQVTSFPREGGISIGLSSHHALVDAKVLALFMEAWAHMNRQILVQAPTASLTLPPELTPSVILERKGSEELEGISLKHSEFWSKLSYLVWGNPRSLKLLPSTLPDHHPNSNLLLASYRLSTRHIHLLRHKVSASLGKSHGWSTLVLAYAYTLGCLVKTKGLSNSGKDVHVGLSADCRARSDPPFPDNYLGNCVITHSVFGSGDVDRLGQEDGLAFAATRLGALVDRINKDGPGSVLEAAKNWASKIEDVGLLLSMEVIGVAWSNRFRSYSLDFGWGKPAKVELPSIDKTGGIYVLEGRDGAGGIEIGLALKQLEMDEFARLFVDGLKL